MVSDTVGGPTLHAVRRLATNVVLPVRARRFSASRGQVDSGGVRFQSSKKLGRRLIDIRDGLQRKLLGMSAILLFIGSVGWCWPVLSELRSLIAVSPAAASIYPRISYCQRFNRCRGNTFFVSSYTPHTAPHNAYLERLLRERSVPYSSELRSSHLQGMVTFLPAGDISHRDFVSHAWADYPIKDILVRMDDADQGIETAGTMRSPAGAIASRRN